MIEAPSPRSLADTVYPIGVMVVRTALMKEASRTTHCKGKSPRQVMYELQGLDNHNLIRAAHALMDDAARDNKISHKLTQLMVKLGDDSAAAQQKLTRLELEARLIRHGQTFLSVSGQRDTRLLAHRLRLGMKVEA